MLEFIKNADASYLSIDPKLYKDNILKAEARLREEDLKEANKGGIFS